MCNCNCHDHNHASDTLVPKLGVVTDIRIDTPDVKTFRVNADGMVRETNFAEGIIPFNHFEW